MAWASSDVLAGRLPLEDALQRRRPTTTCASWARGRSRPTPASCCGSKAMQQVLQKLATSALVVVDAPPLLPVTDAAVLAAGADGAFVVVAAGKTLDHQLASALEHLTAVEAKTLGVVLNRISRGSASQYGGYYGHASLAAERSAQVGQRSTGKRRALSTQES